jgi:GT2 family glycosyltransferase
MCEGPAETFEPTACSRWKLMKGTEKSVRAYSCCFQAVFAKSMSYTRAMSESLAETGQSGPFDERMEGWGYHETEFAFRARQNGVKCIYDVDCAVYHPSHNPRDEMTYRNIDRNIVVRSGTARNIEYFCRKHRLTELPPWEIGVPTEIPANGL